MGGGLVVVLAWCDDFGDPSTIILYKAVSGGGASDALVTLTRSGDAPDGRYADAARPILTKTFAGGDHYNSVLAGPEEFREAAAAGC